jgi:MoaA/NifB/PqqE/SkfB family radical SAM enzyme
MCYQRNQERELGIKATRMDEELSYVQIKKIVDQTPPYCLIIFSGGEPFCRRDIIDILTYTTGKRKCHIVTNGALITKDEAHKVVDLGVLSIGISVDGNPSVHDAIRGIEGTFERMARTFHEIRDYRNKLGRSRPILNMKTVITVRNYKRLSEIHQVGKELGADYCTFQLENTSLEISALHLNNDLSAYSHPPARIHGMDIRELESQLLDLKRSTEIPIVRFIPDFSINDIIYHYDNLIDINDFRCQTPWIGMNVSPYGDIFPCVNFAIGNINNQPLFELWNNDRFRQFRQTIKRNGLFPGCIGCCDLERKLAS